MSPGAHPRALPLRLTRPLPRGHGLPRGGAEHLHAHERQALPRGGISVSICRVIQA